MAQRHPSLIPLSHDHHYGLALALRLKQGDKALLNDGWTHDRHEQARRVRAFYESELRPHFDAEERVVFPAMQKEMQHSSALVGSLIQQHRKMEEMIAALPSLSGEELDDHLSTLGLLLEQHIRSEERELFPMCEAGLGADRLHNLGKDIEAVLREHRPKEE